MNYNQLDIEIRVMDLYNGKVLYGNDIPIRGTGLLGSIAEFSGQTYEINLSTKVIDINKKTTFDQDIVSVYQLFSNDSFEINRRKVGEGKIEFNKGAYGTYISDSEQGIKFVYLHESEYDFEVIGNRLEFNKY